MTQEEINSQEWHDESNWSRPLWLGIYFSKKDTRSWVPKFYPILGWTINLGNRAGAAWFIGIIAGALVAAFFAGWLTAS
ncbi:hypothetical protein [Idiomarina sp.]|uniref:hypothetical protein n=1 Tax=Idiomarina sp. TaxID=1874361 RepID=UPI003A92FA1F